jgi:nucleotide-binding universal stress UspA family protein
MKMKTILAPVDFSPVTESIVQQVSVLAKVLPARVVLLSIVQPPLVISEYGALMGEIVDVTAAGEKNAAKQLARLQEKLHAQRIKAETRQFTGAPIRLIVEQAKKLDADYIVMGSHGHTALYDLLVGSTTHGVLMRAKCPVVIVPPPKKAKTSTAAKGR